MLKWCFCKDKTTVIPLDGAHNIVATIFPWTTSLCVWWCKTPARWGLVWSAWPHAVPPSNILEVFTSYLDNHCIVGCCYCFVYISERRIKMKIPCSMLFHATKVCSKWKIFSMFKYTKHDYKNPVSSSFYCSISRVQQSHSVWLDPFFMRMTVNALWKFEGFLSRYSGFLRQGKLTGRVGKRAQRRACISIECYAIVITVVTL